jgi:predicted AAA+ superfamily ATPase
VLLTGARGTGKSSLVKAAAERVRGPKGLRLIEVDKRDLVDLPTSSTSVAPRKERFIVFCDDLSFEASDAGYKSLKVALDGSIAGSAENVLIYATSNRRHLMPEFMDENLQAVHRDGEIHPGETTRRRSRSRSASACGSRSIRSTRSSTSTSPTTGWSGSAARRAMNRARRALLWALERGFRSGRVAWQFARDWVGRKRK